MVTPELVLNSIVAGLLLGGFYAAVTLGLSLAFGMLDVVNIAHPVFVILGSYTAYVMYENFGLDPIVTGLIFTPVFYLLGVAIYRIYYNSFEKKGEESLRGLVFFFGVLFIVEVLLVILYGVDYRLLEPSYIGKSIQIGVVGIAPRLLVPFVGGLALTLALHLFLSKTFYGKAIMGVSQDGLALRLMGADPIKIKAIAFGIGIATASLAGALLIILSTVEPSINREYIGRVFAIVVLGGMGSVSGTLVA
ncbi:MAG: branched-chain amino acid ABC transporter permease, partial [Nitrospinota bacterium]